MKKEFIVPFEKVGIKDVALVGGKNASLGEMIRELASKGVRVLSCFIVTAEAYRFFLNETGLAQFIKKTLTGLDTHNLKNLAKRAELVRSTIKKTEFPKELVYQI